MKRIVSRDNATFKALRSLGRSARERGAQGKTLLDGLHLLQTYVRHVGAPLLVLVSEQGLGQREIVRFLRGRDTGAIVLADALFAEISPVETPSGIAGVIAVPSAPAADAVTGSCVVLEGIQDPGNVGSILRTAAAAGIGDALLAPTCARAWSPKVLRAGMGGHFFLRIHEQADAVARLTGYAGRILAADARAARSLYEADLRDPVAWLFGAEGSGLSAQLRGLAHEIVSIPMRRDVESLNVAAAAAVCLFEMRRRGGK